MYSLEDILRLSSDDIVGKVGYKYSSLSIVNLRHVLVNKLIRQGLVEESLLTINDFWDSLSIIMYNGYELSEELLKVIILTNPDINMIGLLCRVSSKIKNIIHDVEFLKQIKISI